jgi:antitoxin component of MazEF toxin-antitoxin module
MEAMLRRRVGAVGNPPSPILHIPGAFARLEGLKPGDEVGVAFDNGILVVAPVERESTAIRFLRGLRSESVPGGGG